MPSLLLFANFIISIGATADSVMTIKFWTMGSLTGTSWSDLMLPAVVVGLAFLFFLNSVSCLQCHDDGR